MSWGQRVMSDLPSCPKCGTGISNSAGFGMVQCPSCGEFVMMGGDAPTMPISFSQAPEPMEKFEFTAINTKSKDDEDDGETPFHTPTMVVDVNFGHNLADDEEKASPILQDVVDFGNQTQPSTGSGSLVYDLRIEGIDTAQMRAELLMCFADKRLQIDSAKVNSEIKDGVLNLDKISPVKASVILNRIRHLPFKINWTSKQLIQSIFILGIFLTQIIYSNLANASEWGRHEVNMKGYASRISNMQDEVQALIVKKNLNKDPKVRDELLSEIIKKNDELKKIYKDYKSEKEHILYEHPEQGDNTERKYRHIKLKSLEELENEVGIDGQLSRIKKKVEEKYPVTSPK